MDASKTTADEFPLKIAMELLEMAKATLAEEHLDEVKRILKSMCDQCISFYGNVKRVKDIKFAENLDIFIGWNGKRWHADTRALIHEFLDNYRNPTTNRVDSVPYP